MIKVEKTNGEEVILNSDLIEQIKETPDTVVTLTNCKKLLVKESADEIIEKIIDYRRKILSGISRTGER
ncbi:MAG: flagellar FlbD family protein [Bacillota bacterium]